MNYVTFKIKETKGGDFVLYLHTTTCRRSMSTSDPGIWTRWSVS